MVEQRAQSKAEAEAVKESTAATRWSERLYTARLEVRTLSAAPKLQPIRTIFGQVLRSGLRLRPGRVSLRGQGFFSKHFDPPRRT